MSIKIFSKSLADLVSIKKSFLTDNQLYLENSLAINRRYIKGPKQVSCKICSTKLEFLPDFTSHSVDYHICLNCGHLNGAHKLTSEFCNDTYITESSSTHNTSLYMEDYHERVKSIYQPKLDFLENSLLQVQNEQLNTLSLADFGCGAGHFVYAARGRGIQASGIDCSRSLINLASENYVNSFGTNVTPPFSYNSDEEHLLDSVLNTKADVSSFIFVLEHVINPLSFFEAFSKSRSRYLFFSVPLFSASVFLEHLFQDVFPRHLSGGHTHLFTHESIEYILQKYNLNIVSSWLFGCDALDLRNAFTLGLKKSGCSERFQKILLNEYLSPQVIDQLQAVLDKNQLSGEIHMLVTKE